jgi:hypothetical protein
MEPLIETIVLDAEEQNELLFKIKVEGVDQAPAKVRLVCEDGDVSYMFNGHPTSDEGVVQFVLPAMKGKLKEGTYLSKVEVLIENRYFAPVIFNINFKQPVTVVAEVIQTPQRKIVPQVKVTASQVAVVKKVPVVQIAESRPLVIEEQRVPVNKSVPTGKTLKEIFRAKTKEEPTQVIDASNEDLIRELAQAFVKSKRR